MKIYKNACELIGGTPVLDLQHPLVPEGKKLYLKLEQFNPNLSIKDRTALGMITKALNSGKLKRNGVIIESTSGNLGKSLAMIGAVFGIKVIVVGDPKISSTSLNWFKAYGAEVIYVTEPDENGGYQAKRIEKVKQLVNQIPNSYWPNQYDNHDNPRYHEEETSQEFRNIDFDILVGCVSTGGHLSGIARGVKKFSAAKILACDVMGSAVLGGDFSPYLLNGIGLAWRSDNTDMDVFDYLLKISDAESISMCREIANKCGILLGGSAGLVVFAGLVALNDKNINSAMVITPDSGSNYLDTIYSDEWIRSKKIEILDSNELSKHINYYGLERKLKL